MGNRIWNSISIKSGSYTKVRDKVQFFTIQIIILLLFALWNVYVFLRSCIYRVKHFKIWRQCLQKKNEINK